MEGGGWEEEEDGEEEEDEGNGDARAVVIEGWLAGGGVGLGRESQLLAGLTFGLRSDEDRS